MAAALVLPMFGCIKDDAKIAVTGVELNTTTLNFYLNGQTTAQLTATITPANATNKGVKWTTDNKSVATVDANGWVTAIAVGVAIITATSDYDSKKYAVCEVWVQADNTGGNGGGGGDNGGNNGGGDDGGTYIPTASDDLRQLILDANAKLRTERQYTFIETQTITENGQTIAYEEDEQLNADTKTARC